MRGRELHRTPGVTIGVPDIGKTDIVGDPMPRHDAVEAFIPVKPTVFLMLMVLAEGEAHGYGIKKEAERRSEGRSRLEPGTLYRLIHKLWEDGLIEESARRPTAGEDERRRYYRLTELGRRVVQAEAHRLAELVDWAKASHVVEESGAA